MASDIRKIAERAMLQRGFIIRFPEDAVHQAAMEKEPVFDALKIPDLTSWLWSSIDNDDSRDLDQIEFAIQERDGIRVYIGLADVDYFVPHGSAIDRAAAQNSTSVYTGAITFHMLPERLSTNLSSLNKGANRLAIVVEILVGIDGAIAGSSIYPAIVQNKAQLTYENAAAWLDAEPQDELQAQVKLQDKAAAMLRERRHQAGALKFHTSELNPILDSGGNVVDLKTKEKNRASLLIEDFMIAANQVTAAFLDTKGFPSIRRVVKTPERWDRIVALAESLGERLPATPDVKSLAAFLRSQEDSNPGGFADLSLSVVKLLGRGEYVLNLPGDVVRDHFSLALQDYSHSTAPNRRYPDLITQRLLKAAIPGDQCPYTAEELDSIARHCTQREDDANKVERLVRKCIAAGLLASRLGEKFDAIVTGVRGDNVWIRLVHPPVDGRLTGNTDNRDVGDRVRVTLRSVDAERGFIDFEI